MHESPSKTGPSIARMTFPKFPARRKTVDVTLQDGQTIGELLCQYTGEFSEENLNTISQLNKNLDDLDFVRPGTVIKLVDNRRPKLATPEAEWWAERGLGNDGKEAGNTAGGDLMDIDGKESNEGAVSSSLPRSADGSVSSVHNKENTPIAVKPKTLKQRVNPNGVDMAIRDA